MRLPLGSRTVLVILASATRLLGQSDPQEIVRNTVVENDRNWKLAQNYSFSERADLKYLDSDGRVKLQEVSLHDVMLVRGSPYRRLIGRSDLPLKPAEERKEQEKLAKCIAERAEESASKRQQRLAEYVRRPQWLREALHELPEAFDFQLKAEELWDGHPVYVIEATPRKAYVPQSRTAKMLVHLRAKLWIAKRDYHLVKAEVEAIDTVPFGYFLVLVAKGSRASFEECLVNDEVWLPRQVRAFASARVGLLKVVRIQQEYVYSKCREVKGESPVVSQLQTR